MENDLLEGMSPSPASTFSLDLFATPSYTSLLAPEATRRNQAATTALLSGNPAEVYQSLLQEFANGGTSQNEKANNGISDISAEQDIKGVVSILSDPTISFEDKHKIMGNIRDNPFLKDRGNTLTTNLLAAPSRGETVDQETARTTLANMFTDLYRARSQVQGLVNAHAASLRDADLKTFAEFVEVGVIPFATAAGAEALASKEALRNGKPLSLWEKFKKGFFAGSTYAEQRAALEKLPPSEWEAWTRAKLDDISKDSGLIAPTDNHYSQYQQAQTIFGEGGYSSLEKFLDNATTLLDFVGLGWTMKSTKGIVPAIKEAKATKLAAIEEAKTLSPFTEAPYTSPFEGKRLERQAAAQKQIDFDPNVPTPDSNAPKGPIPGILSEPTDNVPVLLGGSGKKVVEVVEEPRKKVGVLLSRIEANNTVAIDNPASPAKIAQQVNPEHSKLMHEAVLKSDGDTVAEALYGTSKVDAIASDVMPQVAGSDGAVRSRPFGITDTIDLRTVLGIDNSLVAAVHGVDASSLTQRELDTVFDVVKNDFRNASGLTVNDSMSSIHLDGSQVKVSAVYGAANGAFSSAEDAWKQAKFALRAYGVTDSEMTLLKKSGLDHVPANLEEEVGKEGNYLIRITTNKEISASDFDKMEEFTVLKNYLDRYRPLMTNDRGSVSRWLFDAASMLDKTITGAASVVSDYTARFDKILLGYAEDYANQWKKLPSNSQDWINAYIREANFQGLQFKPHDLLANGASQAEIDALTSWRKFWDAHYYLENYDMVRTLNADGYQVFRNATTDVFAKPIAKNQNIGTLYDPMTASLVQHIKADGDALYQAGGTYAKLRRPINVNGQEVSHMIVRNTPTEFLRRARDTDKVLNYRPGYFQIQYKAPKFIDEVVMNGKEVVSRRAIAVAGDTPEAEHFRARMAANNPGKQYLVRSDDRALARGTDDWWDVNSANGRIAQRVRGQVLEDPTGLNHLGDGNYIMTPVDSAIRAARSIAGRTISRPMLENAKARAVKQYGHLFPSNGFGEKAWPNSLAQIGEKGNFTAKEVADARTTWEYINYLEDGYINTVDNAFKWFLHGLANHAGNAGLSKLERGLNIAGEGGGPISLGKNSVFWAYIGSNVPRQWVVQAHQAIRTIAYNPKGWANGKVLWYNNAYIGNALGLTNPSHTDRKFINFVTNSGLLDNVDKQNLVRGVLRDAADSTSAVVRAASQVFNAPRKIGFDTGERANMLMHLAAVFERYERKGLDVSKKSIAKDAYSETRALSYDMNFAGDMPYNQTSPAIILQFMQVPHKALLQLSNRRLDGWSRLRLFAVDTALWGVPGSALIYEGLKADNLLPEDKETRDAIIWGFESVILNHMWNTIFEADGKPTKVDYSSLAPYDMSGWRKTMEAIYTGGIDQLILGSPAGNLFIKHDSRVQKALRSMSRYFQGFEDPDEDKETLLNVLNQAALISSGWANWQKAKFMLDAQQSMDKKGVPIDEQTTTIEAIHQLFGFGTEDVRDYYKLSMSLSKDKKKYREEVLRTYNDMLQFYADKDQSSSQTEDMRQKISGRLFKIYEDQPEATRIIREQMKVDFQGKLDGLTRQLMERNGIPSYGATDDMLKLAPLDEERKRQLRERLKMYRDARQEVKQEDK